MLYFCKIVALSLGILIWISLEEIVQQAGIYNLGKRVSTEMLAVKPEFILVSIVIRQVCSIESKYKLNPLCKHRALLFIIVISGSILKQSVKAFQFNVVATLASVVEAIYLINGRTFMVPLERKRFLSI